MKETALERRLSRSRARMKRLRHMAERHGVPPDSPLSVAVEELEQTLEALSVTMQQLEVANEKLADARHAAELHALRYRELFESVPDAYLATDEQGVIREANRAAEAKLGRRTRYLVGKPLRVFVAEEHREELERHLARIQRARPLLGQWELRFEPKGAAPFFAAVTAEATHEPDGSVTELHWLLRDVTERRQVEEALRTNEARLRLMADSLPVLLAYVDRDERYRFNSAGYEKWFGVPAEKLWGRSVREVLGDAAYERVREHVARALAGQQTHFEGELAYTTAGKRDVSITYVPHVGDGGEVLGFHALVIDVSEQRRMREQLRATAAAAALAEDRERRQLAQDLHDDLGQLLSLALMKLGALRDGGAERAMADEVREIERLVAKAHSHAESLTFQLSPPILHDRGLVPAAEWLAEDMWRSYGLRVELADDGAPKPLDEATRVALFRSLRELLINVARHSGTREATVRIWRDAERVRMEVRDHGLGFDPGGVSGGFGLVSSRERLCALGGNLEIHSAPGEGARIVAEVPIDGRQRA